MQNSLNGIHNTTFLGWIPCVIGRLDFSKLSTKQLPNNKNDGFSDDICFSYYDEHSIPKITHRKRINVVSSLFDWKDKEDKNNQYDGYFRFITFFKIDEDGSAKGTSYIALHADLEATDKFNTDILIPLKKQKNRIDEYKNAISKDQYNPSVKLDEEELIQSIDTIESKLIDYSQNSLKKHVFKVNFTISANGICYLDAQKRPDVDENLSKEKHSQFIAIKQTFIYLKTILHTHKHHLSEEDRITSIHAYDKNRPKETALRLIDDLRRSVIELKERELENHDSPDHYVQGFISYSRSLIQSLQDLNFITQIEADSKREFFNNMLLSWESVASRITILNEKTNKKEAYIKEKKSIAVTEMFQSVSILLGLISVVFLGFKYILAQEGANLPEHGIYSPLLSIFNSEVAAANTFAVLFYSILLLFLFRISSHEYGVIQRPIRYILTKTKGNYLLLFRAVLLILISMIIIA